MPKIGSLDQFNLHSDDWETYVERFEIYCSANSITEPAEGQTDTRVPILLSLVGGETYKRIRALVTPTTPANTSYNDLKAVLKDKTKPKPTQLAERFRFHKRVQNENEDVIAYDTALREIAMTCGFTDNNDRLRDQLVIGLWNIKIKSEILSKETVTYDAALKLAVAMETANREASSMSRADDLTTRNSDDGVNKINTNQPSRYKRNFKFKPRENRSKCIHCGRRNHLSRECSFKEAICHTCSEKGHIKPVCPNQKMSDKEIFSINDAIHEGDFQFLPQDHS